MSREQLPKTFRPLQPLLDELSDPENRPPVPPLDRTFQRQLSWQYGEHIETSTIRFAYPLAVRLSYRSATIKRR